ncbi:PAS domain S-box protein [Desulfosporosinus fructosivorans]|uniref:histidine kinase n=1 Tax=Desulfosporosinus fructosivorans TaxID=2018669 RepID=A0A4Z0R827_9FIRM|nr:ATP-binding protein [Desulfosporosinus fructosivorans]TGE38565.1 PAS domain S-box protein [Desulfosporosinus fructosivorans]
MREEHKTIKQLIFELRESRNHHEQLQEQLSFASALNLIAETIISNHDTPIILESMAEIIGSTLRLDRTLIYDIDFAKHQLIGLSEWLNPNSPDLTPTKAIYSLDVFGDASLHMKNTRQWQESHVDDYNPHAYRDGSGDLLHKVMQIKSGLWYPFSFREQGYYCLTFNHVIHRRIWRKEEIEFIATAAHLVEIAVQKINFLTEQQQHKEALRLSEERFYKVFHYSPVSMTITSLKSREYIDANECCLNTHGYSRDEFIGSTALALNLWVDLEKRAKYYKELTERGFALNHEIESYKKSGEMFESLLSGVVIELNNEQCVLGTKTNITELRQYQRELSRLASLNLIGEMAAGIAHEIRNPMTTVRGFLQLLSEKEEYLSHIDFFTLMVSELDRANSLITEFLSLVKNKPIELKTQNLNSIIENLFPLIQSDAMITDKYVKLDLDRIENLLIDAKEMRQLILNLVRNGLEAMSPGGILTIKTHMENNTVVLIVKDQGKGIASNVIDKIGTPFFTTKDNGTGLGLATCYSIAARHNASINFDTGPTGSSFYACFNAC